MNKKNYIIMKILMFISSYSPLYIMLFILNYDKYNSFKKIGKLFEAQDVKTIIFGLLLFLLLLISFYSVIDLKRTNGNEYYNINRIERPDDTIISYMMTYIVPLLTTEDLTNKIISINLFLFILIGYMYIRLNLIYLNPLWSLFGYIMYKTDTEMIIITNIPYSKKNQIIGERVKGTLLGGNIYLIQQKDNMK
ncbi:MAG: hypothetical protein ACOWWH_00950 [Eubacteriaceae bacterium]